MLKLLEAYCVCLCKKREREKVSCWMNHRLTFSTRLILRRVLRQAGVLIDFELQQVVNKYVI